MSEKKPEFEIDLIQVLATIWKNILVIILVAAVSGALTFAYMFFMVTPKYEATTTLYVNNSSFSIGATSFSITNSELTTSKNLVGTYVLVLQSRTTLEKVIEKAGLNYSSTALRSMITTEEVVGTAAIKVKVSSTSPTEAELIANTIADILPARISEIVYGTSVQIVDYAIVPSKSSYPNYTTGTVEGALVGGIVTGIIVVLLNLFNQNAILTVDSADELRTMYPEIPVFAVIPDMRTKSRRGYYYSSSYYDSYYGYGYGYGYGKEKKAK